MTNMIRPCMNLADLSRIEVIMMARFAMNMQEVERSYKTFVPK